MFQVSEKLDRSKNMVSGKRKRGGQWVDQTAPLCIVTCEDGSTHTLFSGIRGKLVEMNDKLLSHPQLLTHKCDTQG